jgi:hypothetical protein
MNEMLTHFRRTLLRSDGAGMTNGELLECFVSGRDDDALAALVRRHAARAILIVYTGGAENRA